MNIAISPKPLSVLVVEDEKAAAVAKSLESSGETIFDLGVIEKRDTAPVVFDGELRLRGA